MADRSSDDYFSYVKGEPSEFVKRIYWKKVINEIDHGKVLDLGTGSVGHYWALGYISDIEEVHLTDNNQQLLEDLRNKLNKISSDKIEKDFSKTLDFLREKEILSEEVSSEDLASQIFRKSRVRKLDFKENHATEDYDFAVSMESIGCVNSETQFQKAVSSTYRSLKYGGTMIGVADVYEEGHEYVKQLKNQGLESDLNPGAEEFREKLENAGFSEIKVEEYSGDFCPGYTKILFFKAVKFK